MWSRAVPTCVAKSTAAVISSYAWAPTVYKSASRSFTTNTIPHYKLQSQATSCRAILNQHLPVGQTIQAHGWIRTIRAQKRTTFIAINDGSDVRHVQVCGPIVTTSHCRHHYHDYRQHPATPLPLRTDRS